MMKDQTLLSLYEKVSKECNVNEDVVEYVIKYVFAYIKNQIKSFSSNSIMIHHFGTFNIKEHKLPKYLNNLELALDKATTKKEFISKYEQKIEKLKSMINE